MRLLGAMALIGLVCSVHAGARNASSPDAYLAGYLIIPFSGRADSRYGAGFSMYVAAWTLLDHYPGHQFQTGLPGTWMFAQQTGEPIKDAYSDVEGGLGWWRDTRFPTTTPKFIMGGVAPNFTKIANGPAHGWGTWEEPRGLYGVAQLSPWLLFPIDGLNIRQGMRGELVGYGYLSLPLCDPKPTTKGQSIPTGGECWTLFLNTRNFKGPVAFFLPSFWSESSVEDTRLVGKLLDSRPAEPNRAVQMETQYIPCRVAEDSRGVMYARIAPTRFPRAANGDSILVHRDSVYDRSALWDAVAAWFAGGPAASGSIAESGTHVRTFTGKGYATWEIRIAGKDGKETKAPLDWSAFATPFAPDPATYGYQWHAPPVQSKGRLVTLPEYYRLENPGDEKRARWTPVAPDAVPAETGLRTIVWKTPVEDPQEPYTTPDDPTSCWKKPGPAAGPFKAKLGDGSVVTYYWYRFADQPAMLNAGMTDAERERVQDRVEKLHREWTRNRQYLPPPTVGTLADLDPAQIVVPPKGLEIGYVPIATRQELPAR